MVSQKTTMNLTLVPWEKGSLLYGTDEEKEKVRNTISEVLALVIPRKACLAYFLN